MVDRMLSPEQVAEIMSVSKRSAYDHMNRMYPRWDKPKRVSERVLKEYMESLNVYPPIKEKRRKRA